MDVVLKGLDLLQSWAEGAQADLQKAIKAVLQRGAYDLAYKAQKGLAGGALGLKKLLLYRNDPGDPRFTHRIGRSLAPLEGLEMGITYFVNKDALTADVGFGALPFTGAWQLKIASKSLYGYSLVFSDSRREWFHKEGIHLKATTRGATVPSRDIMGAVSEKYGAEILATMKSNFDLKRAGERF